MKTIIISPFSRQLRNGENNPKNFPFWPDLIELLRNDGIKTIQIGKGQEPTIWADEKVFDASLKKLGELLHTTDGWISVDNFFPHLAMYHKKPGIVIWSVSDPKIFGYEENFNILKDRKYLRLKQFDIWEAYPFVPEAFYSANEIYKIIKENNYLL
jgi:hypothetical protein